MRKKGVLLPLPPSNLMAIGARSPDEVLLALAIEVAIGLVGWSSRGCLVGLYGFWRMPAGLGPPLSCLDGKASIHL
jgi:hypothetical protein